MKIFYEISQLIISEDGLPTRGEAQGKLQIIEDASLVIEEGKFIDYGNSKEILKAYPDMEKISLKGKTVLPSFIDAHTHPVFGGSREEEFAMRLQGVPYAEIAKQGGGIVKTVEATRKASKEELLESTLQTLDAMLSLGVTTIEAKSGYGLDKVTEIKMLEVIEEANKIHPIELIPTFLGAHSFPLDFKGKPKQYLKFLIKKVLPEIKERNLARYCDIWCEDLGFSARNTEYFLNASKELGFRIRLHANELSSFGGGTIAAKVKADSADHMVFISDNEIREMEENDVVATLLPGTMFTLKSDVYAPARSFIDFGVPVAVATDFNPGSCMSENIQMDMVIAAIEMDMTPEEVINAVTVNAAYSLRIDNETGSITKGKNADFIVLDIPNYYFIFYHWGMNFIESVYKNGDLVYNKKNLRS